MEPTMSTKTIVAFLTMSLISLIIFGVFWLSGPLPSIESKGVDSSVVVQYVSLATAVVSLATAILGLVKATRKTPGGDT
jgi:hypothetical protein